MQDIWEDIFTLMHSWQVSIFALQYRAVRTRAFLGKEGVYTLIYPATIVLMYWGFFFKLGDAYKKYITSSDKENVPHWALLFGGSLKLQITSTITQGMLQNSKETKTKACRSLGFFDRPLHLLLYLNWRESPYEIITNCLQYIV